MRYLLFFMFLVGLFVIGRRSFDFINIGGGISAKGSIRTETRNVSNFKGVDLGLPAKVDVSVSEQYLVEVDAADNLHSILKTELKGETLNIYFSENVNNCGEIKIRVSGPNFDHFNIAGSGSFHVNSPIQSEKMNLSIAGSGDMFMEQSTLGTIKCDIAGSGNIKLGGSADRVETGIAGSGDINAKNLAINDLDVAISGSGSVRANVIKSLKASISGSGDVYYTGTPTVDADVSGSGKVKREE
jgi:Putative auto-transporter adhesin, head GIN domain